MAAVSELSQQDPRMDPRRYCSENFLLFCPKCKREELINLQQFHITRSKKPDAKTQS